MKHISVAELEPTTQFKALKITILLNGKKILFLLLVRFTLVVSLIISAVSTFLRVSFMFSDYIESPPKAVNLNRGKLGTRVSHTVTSQDATLPKPTSSASPSLSCPIPRHQGNKIPKVQTETADTTRDDLVDIQKDIEELETNEALK